MSPHNAAFPSRFPHRKSPPFYGVGRLETANRVKLKTWGIFFRLHLATPKSGISPRAEVSFFSNCRPLGIQYSSHCYTKNGCFFGQEIKKSFNT